MSNQITPLPVNTQNNIQNNANHVAGLNKADHNEEPFDNVLEREISENTTTSEEHTKSDENVQRHEVNTKALAHTGDKVVNQIDDADLNESATTVNPEIHMGVPITVLAATTQQPSNNLRASAMSKIGQPATSLNTIPRGVNVDKPSILESSEDLNVLDVPENSSKLPVGFTNQLSKQSSLQQDGTLINTNMSRQNIASQPGTGTANFAAQGEFSLQPEAGLMSSSRVNESTLIPLTDAMPQMSLSQTSTLSPTNISLATQSVAVDAADLQVATQVGQPKWDGEFSQKIVLMANQRNQVAEIRLNPAHLGPVEVSLNIVNDQGTQAATAQFLSGNLAVREAIEASLPKLREMMAENGIELGNVTVGAESSEQQANTSQQEQGSGRGKSSDSGFSSNIESGEYTKVTIAPQSHQGLVNTFA